MRASLRIHEIISPTCANGPGQRVCIWVQGCSLACPACFNPETHDFATGTVHEVETLAEQICSLDGIEGVTISGGEPLQQPSGVIALLKIIKSRSRLSSVIFSGFTKCELASMPCFAELQANVDVIVAGRYIEQQRTASGLLGSSNQEILFFSDRYSQDDFEPVPTSEVVIDADGTITISGVDPIKL